MGPHLLEIEIEIVLEMGAPGGNAHMVVPDCDRDFDFELNRRSVA